MSGGVATETVGAGALLLERPPGLRLPEGGTAGVMRGDESTGEGVRPAVPVAGGAALIAGTSVAEGGGSADFAIVADASSASVGGGVGCGCLARTTRKTSRPSSTTMTSTSRLRGGGPGSRPGKLPRAGVGADARGREPCTLGGASSPAPGREAIGTVYFIDTGGIACVGTRRELD